MTLTPANGSPWWSQDGKLVLVEILPQKAYHLSFYDLVNDGQLIKTEPGLDEPGFKHLYGDLIRARPCDDSVPCEAPAAPPKKN